MSGTTEEIREALTHIFKKLADIEAKLSKQEQDIKGYMEQREPSLDSNELIIAGLKSTRTSFELLRDEIDELHQVTVVLLKRGRG